MAVKLDRGALTAQTHARRAISTVTTENLDRVVDDSVTAQVDARGTRWALGHWAAMTTATIGRQASSRGIASAAGDGGRVVVDVGECSYCQEFAGEVTVGLDPLPPFHPSCTCTASAA